MSAMRSPTVSLMRASVVMSRSLMRTSAWSTRLPTMLDTSACWRAACADTSSTRVASAARRPSISTPTCSDTSSMRASVASVMTLMWLTIFAGLVIELAHAAIEGDEVGLDAVLTELQLLHDRLGGGLDGGGQPEIGLVGDPADAHLDLLVATLRRASRTPTRRDSKARWISVWKAALAAWDRSTTGIEREQLLLGTASGGSLGRDLRSQTAGSRSRPSRCNGSTPVAPPRRRWCGVHRAGRSWRGPSSSVE